MLSIRVKIDTPKKGQRSAGLPMLVRRVEEAQSGAQGVKIGLPRGKAPVDLVQIAIWNHFGTRGGASGGGWGGPIPPRPFLTRAIWRARAQLRSQMRAIAEGINRGVDPRVGLGRLGVYAAGLVQREISQGVPPPNAPVTIRMKGSSKPLVDTGRLRGAITWDYLR